jgi:hypothetical protein
MAEMEVKRVENMERKRYIISHAENTCITIRVTCIIRTETCRNEAAIIGCGEV